MERISNPWFSLLANDVATDWCVPNMGLQQGCPLSPYLSILFSELLSCALHMAVDHKLLKAYKSTGMVPVISHVLFADDCLIVARAAAKDSLWVKLVLDTYCLFSNQAVNTSNSYIMFGPSTPRTI